VVTRRAKKSEMDAAERLGTMNRQTVRENFARFFTQDCYSGKQQDSEAKSSFNELTNCRLMWTQVHGDVKDPVKRALFRPYTHWPELYASVRAVLKSHAELETEFVGDWTRARIMGDAMAFLRAQYGVDAPRWWLPLMQQLRHSKS